LTFETIKAAKLNEFRETITDVSMKAEKKWNIEKKINEMIEKAKETKLDIVDYKSTFILSKLDEI
jgi:dynein heavy chain, axonemal